MATPQERWNDAIDELGYDLIDAEGYPESSTRLTMKVLTEGKAPDWNYEQELLFMKQLNW